MIYTQLVLDDYQTDDPSERSRHFLGGDGSSIWFDKSLTIIVLSDGHVGMNIEHAPVDGTIIVNLMEYLVVNE